MPPIPGAPIAPVWFGGNRRVCAHHERLGFVAEFADTQAADYADRYFDFAEVLEHLFNRLVDVLTKRAIRNPYFRSEVERTAQVLYEDHAQKTLA